MGKHNVQPSTLEAKALRWESRHNEHKASLRDVQPPGTVKASKATTTGKRRKLLTQRHGDQETTRFCVSVANSHIQHAENNRGVFPAAPFDKNIFSKDAAEPNIRSNPFSYSSNSMPLQEFEKFWQENRLRGIKDSAAVEPIVILGDNEKISKEPVILKTKILLSSAALQGDDIRSQLSSLFDVERRYHQQQSRRKQLEGVEIPVDSRFHIRKLLVLHHPDRPFAPCVNKKIGICQALNQMQHPAAPTTPMIAYYTPGDYLLVSQGALLDNNVACNEEGSKNMNYENFCEFCYRHLIHTMVEDSKFDKHKAKQECPSRYYKAGDGEYSPEGMHQQTEKGKVRFSHGVLGNMRMYKKSDFIPAMMRIVEDEIEEIIHVDEYNRLKREKKLPNFNEWIPGWEEVGPFHQQNENAFLQDKQIDPYTRVFSSTAREMTVGNILEDVFEKIHLKDRRYNYAHLFWPMLRCYSDPNYLLRPYHQSRKTQWKRFCVHTYDSVPDPEHYKLYYILLHKINTLRHIIFSEKTARNFTNHVKQKIQYYLISYHEIIQYIQAGYAYSDYDLLTPCVFETKFGLTLSPLTILYPMPGHHHRHTDFGLVKMTSVVRRRDDPLTVCCIHYSKVYSMRLRNSKNTLYDLPHRYTVSDSHDDILKKNTTSQAVLIFESEVAELQRKFQENVACIHSYGVTFTWKEPKLGRNKSHANEVYSGPDAANKKKKQHKAIVRAFKSADNVVNLNFKQIENWVAEKTDRYNHLLAKYGELVFCTFSESLKSLREVDEAFLFNILADFELFSKIMPKAQLHPITIDVMGVNNQPWSRNMILFTLLMRVSILEELWTLEPNNRNKIRFNLILLRNSHLKLFRKIFENPTQPLHDNQLAHKPKGTLSILQMFYPYPTREIHQGCLPDYVNSLGHVDFFTDGGMNLYSWNKILYKLFDRCCNVREFSDMLVGFCKDPAIYRWVMLTVRISLSGLYEHCTVVPCFARSVTLDELFDNALVKEMKPAMLQFILNHDTVILNAMSESLCYQLELVPALLSMLKQTFRGWSDWRIFANTDMMRYLFSVEGHFQSVYPIVVSRINLKSMRTVFRLFENDFVLWVCRALKQSDEDRYKHNKPAIPLSAALDPIESIVIQNFIYIHGPDDVIDVNSLAIIGLKPETLDILNLLYSNFILRFYKNIKQEPPPERAASKFLTVAETNAVIQSMEPKQYLLLYRYLTLLKHYQSIQVIQMNNADLLRKQVHEMTEKPIVKSLGRIPEYSNCCAFSLCCGSVKNSWSMRAGSLATGFEEVVRNIEHETHVCAKKNARLTPEEMELEELADPSKKKRRSDREMRRPDCAETEIFTVSLLGVVVEADTCKIPGVKRASMGSAAKAAIASAPKKKSRNRPIPGYWITPCCGVPSEFDGGRFTLAGYACKTCKNGVQLYNSFRQKTCSCCRSTITHFHLIRVFDDVYVYGYRHVLVCVTCYRSSNRVILTKPLLSLILRYIKDPLATAEWLYL